MVFVQHLMGAVHVLLGEVNMTISTSINTRAVIEGVPRIQFYSGGPRCPEDLCFPSALRAYLEYVNDKDYGCRHCIARTPACEVNCTYSFLIGVSGIASMMWQAWNTLGGIGNPEAHLKFSDPAARRQLAQIALQSHDKYANAAEHIKHALALPTS